MPESKPKKLVCKTCGEEQKLIASGFGGFVAVFGCANPDCPENKRLRELSKCQNQ